MSLTALPRNLSPDCCQSSMHVTPSALLSFYLFPFVLIPYLVREREIEGEGGGLPVLRGPTSLFWPLRMSKH